jgi:hypothetical protein
MRNTFTIGPTWSITVLTASTALFQDFIVSIASQRNRGYGISPPGCSLPVPHLSRMKEIDGRVGLRGWFER